jgi:hypothetical protein
VPQETVAAAPASELAAPSGPAIDLRALLRGRFGG